MCLSVCCPVYLSLAANISLALVKGYAFIVSWSMSVLASFIDSLIGEAASGQQGGWRRAWRARLSLCPARSSISPHMPRPPADLASQAVIAWADWQMAREDARFPAGKTRSSATSARTAQGCAARSLQLCKMLCGTQCGTQRPAGCRARPCRQVTAGDCGGAGLRRHHDLWRPASGVRVQPAAVQWLCTRCAQRQVADWRGTQCAQCQPHAAGACQARLLRATAWQRQPSTGLAPAPRQASCLRWT